MLKVVDLVVIKQMQHYISAESLGIQATSLEAIPATSLEEVKESRNEAEGDEEAKGDVEDFIRQEIESPGLMPSATYCHEISNTQLQGS